MKIVYVITKSNWGGAQRHVYDLATHAKAKGHDVVVVLGTAGHNSNRGGELIDRLEAAGVRTVLVGSLRRDINIASEWSSFMEMLRAIRMERPDIVHLHSPKAAGLGGLASRLLGVNRIIMTAHGWNWNEDRGFIGRTLIYFFTWLTIVLATDVITLSIFEYEQAARLPFTRNKLRLIPLGIEPPAFLTREQAREFFIKKIDTRNKTVIGTISELHLNKGLSYCITSFADIVKKFPSTVMIVIGEGEERPHLERLIRDFGLDANVALVGHVSQAATYLKAFDIFTLTSLKEGLPYAVIEAGYAGLPIVATMVGGIPEMIANMKSGLLIQPKRTEAISDALTFMLEHPSDASRFGTTIHEKMTADFAIGKMFTTIDALYDGRK